MKIATWNSQGKPTTDPKQKILKQLLNDCDFVLIQECGGLTQAELDAISAHKILYSVGQAGALNNRCTTCIITRHVGLSFDSKYLQSDTGRSVIYTQYNGMVIGTLHSNAGGSGQFDATTAMSLINSIGENTFIVGGDFNCQPSELPSGMTRTVQIGTASRGFKVYPSNCGKVTHPGSGKELDFFLRSEGVFTKNTERHHEQGGDHYPVVTEVS
ncbi:endonuclease/exonuclease/phosphatase family protein [Hahella chejuensis]|uniref:endonuclease/exonuclease/phosphatase family protein n=1 Tax=Hahella chejuensis TaxID=158327 RepID=UPI0005A0E4AE|nr:endonuclease/exonuclease/phosphatase family protein [Hahella chejuensis]